MSEELVKDYMTAPAISISAETGLSDAHKIMADKKVRRLPVVEKDKLVGIVSLTDVLEAKPSTASPLSMWEVGHLVSKMKVKDIMTTDIFSIDQDATIADAARMMLEKKFSGIPVTDNGKLIGIITESDIFRILAIEGRYLSIHHQRLWRSGAGETA